MGRFAGKVALITGAAGGFGQLLARRLEAEGARLILGDLQAGALSDLARAHPEALALPCDVTDEAQVRALVEAGLARFGGLDIAVNNAGVATSMTRLTETAGEDLDLAFAVNAKGVFFGMKYQIPPMRARGGAILNVASVAGIGAAPKLAAYAAAKHAVVGLTRTAAVEEARHNIRVNAICPFYSPTAMVTASDMADKQDFLARGSPMKRLGTPQEMVAAMLALLDPENSYMTGQAVAVDGGVSAF